MYRRDEESARLSRNQPFQGFVAIGIFWFCKDASRWRFACPWPFIRFGCKRLLYSSSWASHWHISGRFLLPQYFWKVWSQFTDTNTTLRTEFRLAIWYYSRQPNDRNNPSVAAVLFRSNLYGFYYISGISFALNPTTIATEHKKSLNDAFYNYTSVSSAAMDEIKRVGPEIETMEELYKRSATVWSKGVFPAFLAAFKDHLEWKARDWEVMELILKEVLIVHITTQTLPGKTAFPIHLRGPWHTVSEALGSSSNATLEESKVKLQEQFSLARKSFEARQ